jgi:hypothetical protein
MDDAVIKTQIFIWNIVWAAVLGLCGILIGWVLWANCKARIKK